MEANIIEQAKRTNNLVLQHGMLFSQNEIKQNMHITKKSKVGNSNEIAFIEEEF
jgi:hypothetical protein